MKSALSTRMRMVARKPVSSSTVTQELMMENQWICAQEGRQWVNICCVVVCAQSKLGVNGVCVCM